MCRWTGSDGLRPSNRAHRRQRSVLLLADSNGRNGASTRISVKIVSNIHHLGGGVAEGFSSLFDVWVRVAGLDYSRWALIRCGFASSHLDLLVRMHCLTLPLDQRRNIPEARGRRWADHWSVTLTYVDVQKYSEMQAVSRIKRPQKIGESHYWPASNWSKSIQVSRARSSKLIMSFCSSPFFPSAQNVKHILGKCQTNITQILIKNVCSMLNTVRWNGHCAGLIITGPEYRISRKANVTKPPSKVDVTSFPAHQCGGKRWKNSIKIKLLKIIFGKFIRLGRFFHSRHIHNFLWVFVSQPLEYH